MSSLAKLVRKSGYFVYSDTGVGIDVVVHEMSKLEKYYSLVDAYMSLMIVDKEYKKERVIRLINSSRNVPFMLDSLAMTFEDMLDLIRNDIITIDKADELLRLFVRTKKWLDVIDQDEGQYSIPLANFSKWIDALYLWKEKSHNTSMMVEIINEILTNPTKENVLDRLNLYIYL
jgi:hypothetical protein